MTDEINDTETQEVEGQTSVDDIFNDDVQQPEQEQEVETESKGEPEAGQQVEPEPKPTEPPAVEDESVPKKALTEERRKRQLAEQRLKELESQAKPEPKQEEAPDPIEDPEGWKQHIAKQNNLNAINIKVSLSRDMMIDANPDYEEKEKVFMQIAEQNPFYVQQMYASPNPAKFAYQTAVKYLEAQKLSEPEYVETLKEEIRKQVLAELQKETGEKTDQETKAEEGKLKKKTPLDVPNLTKAAGAGKNTVEVAKEATLDDIFDDSPL